MIEYNIDQSKENSENLNIFFFISKYHTILELGMIMINQTPRPDVTSNTESLAFYAVKAQTSLAPLSRFRGSRITTAHAHQCCRFQSYAKTVPSRMKLTSDIDKA